MNLIKKIFRLANILKLSLILYLNNLSIIDYILLKVAFFVFFLLLFYLYILNNFFLIASDKVIYAIVLIFFLIKYHENYLDSIIDAKT